MNLAQLLAILEQLTNIGNTILPLVEAIHPLGAKSTTEVNAGLTAANTAVKALQASAPAAASTPVTTA